MKTIKSRDEDLEKLWADFADIPMNPETGEVEAPFLHFPAGTPRADIWRWFDERHSKGVAFLLYGDNANTVASPANLYRLKQLCKPCDKLGCYYKHNGECRFPLVHEQEPEINENGECAEYQHDSKEPGAWWFDVGSLSCRCNQCGCKATKESRFCPNCGTEMDL